MRHFSPYANEKDVVRIGGLEIGNRTDRIALTGDLVLTRDKAGLVLARELQALLSQVVSMLESEKPLADKLQTTPARDVDNPF